MSPTVLIVEDEAAISSFIAEALLDEGYRVLTAPNGAQALKVLRQYQPDLILSDMMMPIMDGLQLCLTLKAHPATHAIPVIIMSAMVDIPPQLYQLARVLITKPLDLGQLLATIESVLTYG